MQPMYRLPACNAGVCPRPRAAPAAQRTRQIEANLVEVAGAAADLVSDAGFGKSLDEPAAASEIVDGFFGEVLQEAASASDTVDIGLTYVVLIDEPAVAGDALAISEIGLPPVSALVPVLSASRAGIQSAVTGASGKTQIITGVGAVM